MSLEQEAQLKGKEELMLVCLIQYYMKYYVNDCPATKCTKKAT